MKNREDLKDLQIKFLWLVNRLREVYLKESGKGTTLEQEALLRNLCGYSEPESDTIDLNKSLIEDMDSLTQRIQGKYNWPKPFANPLGEIFTENLRAILLEGYNIKTEIEKKRNSESNYKWTAEELERLRNKEAGTVGSFRFTPFFTPWKVQEVRLPKTEQQLVEILKKNYEWWEDNHKPCKCQE